MDQNYNFLKIAHFQHDQVFGSLILFANFSGPKFLFFLPEFLTKTIQSWIALIISYI